MSKWKYKLFSSNNGLICNQLSNFLNEKNDREYRLVFSSQTYLEIVYRDVDIITKNN